MSLTTNSKIEDLSTELWLEIFAYLKIRQQFHAFYGLNKRFNQTLLSFRTHISWRNNDKDAQHLLAHVLPYMTHPKNVTGLRLENTRRVDFNYYGNLFDFPRLKALFLHRLNITEDLHSIIQRNSTYLRYLYISQTISCDKLLTHKFLETILSLQNLQTCSLRLRLCMTPLRIQISSKSSIKNLRLMGTSENCTIDRLIKLLEYLPQLQSLYIIANQLSFISTKSKNNEICAVALSSFTLNIKEFIISFVQLTDFIIHVMPFIQELKIVCRTAMQDLNYLNIHDWIKFVKSSPNLKKVTFDVYRGNEIDEQKWNNRCQMLIKSMTLNHITLRIGK
ncbi:unnamed protein product [Rotaria socialis]|uniref:F-box domain-containing protein n=1 Tax=Rotaria socialis TaxID=392032 RepID=A0A820C267_9BILA|nr:unnamed protein product [Rotaria socialis]CAF3631866.1 unnamed protein product [Rotaria socialis]CAF4209402.1 unnamed protein product [Rotaria socialis]CAF4215776.1 unnamed protein product [Rotaria socialis]